MKACLLVIVSILFLATVCSADDKILLSNVKRVVGIQGKYVQHRRVHRARLQLQRIGGNAPLNKEPHTIVCDHTEYGDWECSAELSKTVQLGNTQVVCEGYNHPGDLFVLKDSCAIEYELVRKHTTYDQSTGTGTQTNTDGGTLSSAFVILFMLLLCIIIVSVVCCGTSSSYSRNGYSRVSTYDEPKHISRTGARGTVVV